ncbi:methionyl-tRNA formyltransferase Fmt [Thermacetogenium phaeum DSM 12270]|uniref:Methionyl-tRNA formyltransferase n=1 Tax=Thermacetogenium phaeum (strain ATCC BAA-254 / DSM 26808 / PB) TaxID=1089553 RepID=K4LHU3_THEPS|nr:methionyl-tRNA formyltransferase [Thermacetogenium phaeum]AFV11637.1 methionyl-tRNA formyltransferase Fmt [Thermacetogenium phaeum DSM 12270]MDN5365154.1 methionyl-tRNA formyltransferase [Thermacetogenium sp.]
MTGKGAAAILKILFMGTSSFGIPTLKRLKDTEWTLLGVVTRPDRPRGRGRRIAAPPVKEFAVECGLPFFQPEDAGELNRLLEGMKPLPDVIVVVAFGMLMPQPVLNLPRLGCINLHPSLLPAYRGAAPIERAVMNGERSTGVTTMFISPEMDAGDIILQEEVPIGENTTAGELASLLAEKGAALMLKTLSLLEEGSAPRRAQDHRLATYAPPIRREEELIDWKRSAGVIFNQIRGMNPRPGAYTVFKGKTLKVWRALVVSNKASGGEPGDVVALDPQEGFVVQTGSGRLLLTEVQPAGKNRMSGAEFLRGYRISPGMRLG